MHGARLRCGLMRVLGKRCSNARWYALLLLLGLVLKVGIGNVASRGPEPPKGIFSPPPKHRIPSNINTPGALFYLFHLRSCAADAEGGSRGGGNGGNTSYQEDVVSKRICSIVRMCPGTPIWAYGWIWVRNSTRPGCPSSCYHYVG